MTGIGLLLFSMFGFGAACTVVVLIGLRPGADRNIDVRRGFDIDPLPTHSDVVRAPSATLDRPPTFPELQRSIETIVAQQSDRRAT